jgi:hypothetical protein
LKQSQKNNLAVREFQGVMVRPRDALIDLAKDRGLVLDSAVFHGHKRIRLISFAKDNSVPGSKQTATYLFSGAENPRV